MSHVLFFYCKRYILNNLKKYLNNNLNSSRNTAFVTFSIGHINDFAGVEIDSTFIDVSVALENVLLAIDQLMIEEE